MAGVCYSDSDTDSYDSYDDGEGEEYSNIDYGIHSLLPFGPPSIYGTTRRRKQVKGEDIYEPVGEANDIYSHTFFTKVGSRYICTRRMKWLLLNRVISYLT